MRRAPRLVLIVALMLAACGPPSDPLGTTEAVEGDILILGWVAGVPREGKPELALAARLAQSLDAELEIVEDDLHTLVDALHHQRIHALAGDLPRNSPFAVHYGMTNRIGPITHAGSTTDRVMAIRKGENGFLMRLNTLIEPAP